MRRAAAKPRTVLSGIALELPSGASSERYAVRRYMRIPFGEARGRVALWRHERAAGRCSVVAYAVGRDGGVWVVDYPSKFGGPRAQRFDAHGRSVLERALEPRAAVMTGSPRGDLFYVLARGVASKAERVVRLDRRGRRGLTYEVPAGLNLTAAIASPDGAVFGRTEVWRRDLDAGDYVLQPRLTLLGNLRERRVGPVGQLAGFAFVSGGELVGLESRVRPGGTGELYGRVAQYFTGPDEPSRAYRLASELSWVGGDAKRRVYAEVVPLQRRLTVEQRLVGQAVRRTRQVIVFDPDGQPRSIVNLPWDPLVGSVASAGWVRGPIQVDDTGRIYIAGAEPGAFILWVAEPAALQPEHRDEDARLRTRDLPTGSSVRFWASEEPASFDPFATERSSQLAIMHLVFSGLTRRDASGASLPDLAQRVPTVKNGGVSADGLRISYRLRPGVRFSDGTLVSASDAVATWRFAKRRTFGESWRPRWVELVEDVRAVGQDGIEVELKRPVAWAVQEVLPFILPGARLKGDPYNLALWEAPLGCGPYRLVEWQRGKRMRFIASDTYHGHRPQVGEIDVRFTFDDSKTSEFLATERPTVWEWLGPREAQAVERARHGRVVKGWADFWWGYVFNNRRPPFDEQASRLAFAHAYPRKVLDAGYLQPLDSWVVARPIRPDSWAYRAQAAGPRESTLTAARLLRETGWVRRAAGPLMRGGRQFEFTIASAVRTPYNVSELLQDAYELVAEANESYGASVSTAITDPRFYDPYTAGGTLAIGDFWVAYGAFPGGADPTKDWPFLSSDAPSLAKPWGLNVSRLADPVLDRLYAEAELPAPVADRRARVRRLLDRLERSGAVVVERPGEKVDAVYRVEGVQPSDGPWGDFHNVEYWRIVPDR